MDLTKKNHLFRGEFQEFSPSPTYRTYRVPHVVFRFLMSFLIKGRAIMCVKCKMLSYLPSRSENNERYTVPNGGGHSRNVDIFMSLQGRIVHIGAV